MSEDLGQHLANALQLLLSHQRLSSEPQISNLVYRTPADQMREFADRMDAEDKAIMFARDALRRWNGRDRA